MFSSFNPLPIADVRGRLLTIVVSGLAIAACGSAATDAETAAPTSTAPVDAEIVDVNEAETEEQPEETPEAELSQDAESNSNSFSLTTMGTDVVVTFNEAAAIFEGSGVVAMGREATFGPFESAFSVMRPTGFATLEQRGDASSQPPFSTDFQTWLAHPEIVVADQEQTAVGGFESTRTDFHVEPSDDIIGDCGPPGQDQCLYLASTPDPGDLAIWRTRTGRSYRVWEVDQGTHAPLLILASAIEGDDTWLETIDAVVETIELGEPMASPGE